MSRSRRQTAICGWTTAASEKRDKVIAHRRVRAAVRDRLVRPADPEAVILPDERELVDPYFWDKDGKQHFDPASFPEGMRK